MAQSITNGPSRRLRVAVIGAGRMGTHHARVYASLPDCELVAVLDKHIERARKVAGEFGGQAAARLDDLTREIDAVSVAVPTVYHAEVAIPLLERGIPVLVEKPMAPDTKSARQLLDAARRHSCLLQVGHSERFNPVVQAMLRMDVRPRFIETQRVSPFTFRSADIGTVFDMMIHDIDIVLHLVGEATELRATKAGARRSHEGGTQPENHQNTQSPNHQIAESIQHSAFRIPHSSRHEPGRPAYTMDAVGVCVLGATEDVANARVRFADGTVANMTASRLALKTDRRIRVFCPTAYLTMDYQRKTGLAVKLKDNLDLIRMARERNFEDLAQMATMDYGSMVKVEPLVVEDVEPLRAEITAFLQSVRTGAAPAVSAEEGFAAVEMAERITEAIRAQDWGRELHQAAAQEA
jgi:predicted dehydrogenase